MASLPIHPAANPQTPSRTPFERAVRSSNLSQAQIIKLQRDAKNHPPSYTSYFHHVSSLCREGQIQQAVDLLTEMDSKNFQIGPDIYGELLQGCVYDRDLFTGQQIHARIVKNGSLFAKNEYVETKLVIFYAKCDVLEVVNRLFRRLAVQNVFSWAAIIGLYSRMALSEEALLGYCQMLEDGFSPDNFVVPNALKACGALQLVGVGQGVHGYVVKMGYTGCVFVASSLIDMYGKCGALEDALKLFASTIDKNVVAWNSMIVGYVQNGFNQEALKVFHDMRVESIDPTGVTVSSFLSASASLGALEEGKQGHAVAVLNGLELDSILGSSIINFYLKLGLIEDAELVFDRMSKKDTVTWNLLISGYVRLGQVDKALAMCIRMRLNDFSFDSVTLASILSASADTHNLKLGKEGHCFCLRNNLESDVIVASGIVDMYAKCGKIEDARQVFDSATKRDLTLWNTMLAAYAGVGISGEVLKLFYQMQLNSVPPSVISWNLLILGLLSSGQVNEAKDFFAQMKLYGIEPNLVTWTTLISGLAQNGLQYEAILTFQQMQEAGIKPNSVSISSVLSACADATALWHGRALHGYIKRHNLCFSMPIANSLVDMYVKCGHIEEAKQVFNMVVNKELPVYNAMISGYALHGQAVESLALFEQLKQEGLRPDSITFTSVLSACNHAGMVDEGMEVFKQLISSTHVKPSVEHYGCIINLLSRSGNMSEAFRLVLMMPYEPDALILGSLLAACQSCHEIEFAEYLYRQLLRLEPDNSGNYIALSNTYAAAGKWNDVLKVRGSMKQKGLKKNPGCSWIKVSGELSVFISGDRSHSKIDEIHAMLSLLKMELSTMEYYSYAY